MSAPAPQVRSQTLEVRLNGLSPLPSPVNGACVFILIYGAYLLVAQLVGQPVFETGPDGTVQVDSGAWVALVLSLIFAASVTFPALSMAQWLAVSEKVAATLDESGAARARAMNAGAPVSRGRAAAIAFGVGALGGVVFNAWLLNDSGLTLERYLRSTGGWFALVAPVLFGLGARSALQLRQDDRDMAELVAGHLAVTPASFDRLEVYGRLALRSALAWLVMAAIILLFFVNAAPVFISAGALVFFLFAAAYAFASTIAPVVRAASEIRARALAEVRQEIEAAAAGLLTAQQKQAGEAGRLADLIAYEGWLEKRPVWPVSAPITRRLALYGFIPVLAWFGAAAAERVLEALA